MIPVTTANSKLRWDCIYINDKPVSEREFKHVEDHFKTLNQQENIQASEFELLTATAFLLFNEANVRYGIVEVGMGGLLDATNILNNRVVSVITKIAHDHQAFLGNSLQEIARHKAGILRPNVPYMISPANELQVQLEIHDVAKHVGAGPHLNLHVELERELTSLADWRVWETLAFKLPHFQRHNALLAFFAVKEALGGHVRLLDSLRAIEAAKNPGRCEMHTFPPVFEHDVPELLVDGAHNEDAAMALSEYVDNYYRKQPSTREFRLRHAPNGGWPITWVMAMSEGKDPVKILEKLLRPGDSLVLTTFGPVDGMPWVKPMEPKIILEAARKVVPDITAIVMRKRGLHQALMVSRFLAGIQSRIILTGSLYLVGDFLREKTRGSIPRADRIAMRRRWKNKVNHFLSKQAGGGAPTLPDDGLSEEEDEEDIESSEEDNGERNSNKSTTQPRLKKRRVPSNDRRESRARPTSRERIDALDKYFRPKKQ